MELSTSLMLSIIMRLLQLLKDNVASLYDCNCNTAMKSIQVYCYGWIPLQLSVLFFNDDFLNMRVHYGESKTAETDAMPFYI